MKYRREIDGLRALAVLPVILFHAGFPTFSGGFVGVDIFFVISGYLITSILLKEISEGSFSLIGFYDRRARRILPALYLVMAVSTVFSYFWLWPSDMLDFGRSLVAVSLFGSNFLFWSESGYFETAAELKPLLHTWSLAVEEQYYVIFPLLLLLIWKLGQRWMLLILGILALFSLALAEWGSTFAPSATFFLLPARGWELLIGAFTAFYIGKTDYEVNVKDNVILHQASSILGILLILYAITSFDSSTPFPSLYTLIPTSGAALIILSATPSTLVGRLLGCRVLVGIGLVSYSAYLWHQPFFAFVRHQSVGDPSNAIFLLLSVLSFVAAYFSWHFIEQPFRDRSKVKRTIIFTLSITIGLVFILLGNYINNKEGFVVSFTEQQKEVMAFKRYDKAGLYREGTCFLGAEQTFNSFSANCAGANNETQTLIWGDSHAAALSGGMRQLITNLSQYTASGCPPVLEFGEGWRPNCKAINDFVITQIHEIRPDRLFLHANWYRYHEQNRSFDLNNTLNKIKTLSPNTEVFVIGGVPQWHPNLPTVLLQNKITLDQSIEYLVSPMIDELKLIDDKLNEYAASSGVTFLSALDGLCSNNECLVLIGPTDDKQLTAWDEAHLTEYGAIALTRSLLSKITD